MLVSLLFVRKISIDWSLFNTEPMMISACEMCSFIVDKYRDGTIADLVPLNDSECASNATFNPYCGLVKNVSITIEENFKNRVPRNACEMIGPCVNPSHAELTGELCYPCRFFHHIATLLTNVKDKVGYMKFFCSSSRHTFAKLCTAVEHPNAGEFWSTLGKVKNSAHQCHVFCHKRGEKPPTRQKSRSRPISQEL